MRKDNVVLAEISFLKDMVDKGFKEVHRRQDTTNGRISRHSDKIDKLEQDIIRVEESYVHKDDFSQHEIVQEKELNKLENIDMKKEVESKDKIEWMIKGGAIMFVFSFLLEIAKRLI